MQTQSKSPMLDATVWRTDLVSERTTCAPSISQLPPLLPLPSNSLATDSIAPRNHFIPKRIASSCATPAVASTSPKTPFRQASVRPKAQCLSFSKPIVALFGDRIVSSAAVFDSMRTYAGYRCRREQLRSRGRPVARGLECLGSGYRRRCDATSRVKDLEAIARRRWQSVDTWYLLVSKIDLKVMRCTVASRKPSVHLAEVLPDYTLNEGRLWDVVLPWGCL